MNGPKFGKGSRVQPIRLETTTRQNQATKHSYIYTITGFPLLGQKQLNYGQAAPCLQRIVQRLKATYISYFTYDLWREPCKGAGFLSLRCSLRNPGPAGARLESGSSSPCQGLPRNGARSIGRQLYRVIVGQARG